MLCDLHIHTSWSYDGLDSPEKIVKAAIKRKIDCICITDHNETKGAVEALRFAFDKSILIIPGIEIKSKEGDILGINVKKKIDNNLSAKETIKKIKQCGGMAIIPHPFGFLCSFKTSLQLLLSDLDGIEALNGSLFGSGNKTAQRFIKQFNLPFTVGSDAHSADFVGRVYLETENDIFSAEDLINAIKNKNVYLGGKKPSFINNVGSHIKRNIAKMSRNNHEYTNLN